MDDKEIENLINLRAKVRLLQEMAIGIKNDLDDYICDAERKNRQVK